MSTATHCWYVVMKRISRYGEMRTSYADRESYADCVRLCRQWLSADSAHLQTLDRVFTPVQIIYARRML